MHLSFGTLPSTGIFGSRTTLTATSPDTKSPAPTAGRTLPCSRGVYWRSEGFTACEDVTAGQARISDGAVKLPILDQLPEDIRMVIISSKLMVGETLVVVMEVLVQLVVMAEAATQVVVEDQVILMDLSLLLMLTWVVVMAMPVLY